MGGVSMEALNDYSGFLSFLAVVVSAIGIVVSVILYFLNERSKRKDYEDELDAINRSSVFPIGSERRKGYQRKLYLENKLKKK